MHPQIAESQNTLSILNAKLTVQLVYFGTKVCTVLEQMCVLLEYHIASNYGQSRINAWSRLVARSIQHHNKNKRQFRINAGSQIMSSAVIIFNNSRQCHKL